MVKINICHRPVTGNYRLPLAGLYKGEYLDLKVDQEEGSCEISCRLRDDEATIEFLNRMREELHLSDKPQKHSREIPQWLEIKLLCDSMHLCNVCREEDVILHHMKAVEDGGKTDEDNLIVLCLTHHRQVHSKSQLTKNISAAHLREYKKRHMLWVAARGTMPPLGQIVAVTDGESEAASNDNS